MAARVDFREERGTTQPNEFTVLDILHIEDDGGPDVAFLKVANTSAAGLSLASERYFLGVAALGAGDESLARLALGASATAGGSWGERSAELLERLDGAE